jgi:hypothetical protein
MYIQEVTEVAAAATLGISNLLCSKVLSAKLVAFERLSASSWRAASTHGDSTYDTDHATAYVASVLHTHTEESALRKTLQHTTAHCSTPVRQFPSAVYQVTCAQTGAVTSTDVPRGHTVRSSGGAGTMVRGLLRQLSHFPSHAAVSSATAIGNLARHTGGLDVLLESGEGVLEMLEDLADMVDDALEDARAEALTALCNLLEDGRALQVLVRSADALDDIVSGVASCVAPYRVREAMDGRNMEVVTDAAALIGRVLTHPLGEAAVLAHEHAAGVAVGLAAMAHRCADQESSEVALEALCAMLDGARERPMLVCHMYIYE